MCPACRQEDETILHVLRDCIIATQIWIILRASIHITNFFPLTCRDWIFDNISGTQYGLAHYFHGKMLVLVDVEIQEAFRRPNNPIHVIPRKATKIDRYMQTHSNGGGP
jgi:hypothetical protein